MDRSQDGAREPIVVSRRQLLQMLGLGAGGVVLGGCSTGASSVASSDAGGSAASSVGVAGVASKATSKSTSAKSRSTQRVLVVIELQGGHDGFAMLVPYGDARFRRLRERIWVDPKELHVIDDRYALAKGLEPLAGALAFVEGVGVAKPDLSHFAMLDRWWTGDPGGDKGLLTGFLGRCCDAIAGSEPVTGISVGGGSTPALVAAKATAVSMPALDSLRDFAADDEDARRMRRSLGALASGRTGLGDATSDALLGVARHGLAQGIELAGVVGRLGDKPKGYPDEEIASSLAAIRQLISAGSGIRVFHVPWGSFDTHSGAAGTHSDHMARLGAALSAFRRDLEANGLADRVLVATTSEFGRRPEANGGGTDHGTASTMALLGPVRSGRHGTPVDFTKLDDTGNVRATVSMTDYYATLATWLGARPTDVLATPATAIDTLWR